MVMLLFSTKKCNLPKGVQKVEGFPTAIEFTIYLNILGIIVLAEPAERSSECGSHPFTGQCDFIHRLDFAPHLAAFYLFSFS